MKTSFCILICLILACPAQSQTNPNTLHQTYWEALKSISRDFEEKFYPHRAQIYSLPEKPFIIKIDSLKKPFQEALDKHQTKLGKAESAFIASEQRDIDYFFDKIILDYPYFHENHTGNRVKLSKKIQQRLAQHLIDFNKPDLLQSRDFRNYVEAFLRHQSSIEVKKEIYKKSDNKRLDAFLNLIQKHFSNQVCIDFWNYQYLWAHMDDWGVKNIGKAIQKFKNSCQNAQYKQTIDSMYQAGVQARAGHLIKTYKSVDGYDLDIHIFLPTPTTQKSPVMVYFTGGSWTKGNPAWAFDDCEVYAQKGWVGVVVEYRLADRHETTPFEAVKDARSAIRWLRAQASTYQIDTSRIVASGNSAGGHLVLCTALANDWNESTDNLAYSAAPNLLLVNAGVYSLYAENTTDWITRDLKDKSLAKNISPLHLLRKGLPPMLIIHGTKDYSVSYDSAKEFADGMKKLGNDFEFHTLENAPHAIWYDRRFAPQVHTLRKAFLQKYGYK